MGSCNVFAPGCHLQVHVTNGSSRRLSGIKAPPFMLPSLTRKQKPQLDRCRRVSKVVAYFGLKPPPYQLDALEPYMSKKTVELHWGAHHRGYLDKLNNALAKDDILYGYTMDELVTVTYNRGNPLPAFNNAAQVWNHDFFWESMQPEGGGMPELGVLDQIEKDFSSFTNFREKFVEAALTSFGSGWVWLVLKREERHLEIVKTQNAVNPLVWDDIVSKIFHFLSFYLLAFYPHTDEKLPLSFPVISQPIINLDVWEHAYYLDHKNERATYVNAFMDHLVSWDTAMGRMARAEAFVNLGEPTIPIA
ncbi:Superoxide dismutase [Fe] 3, chloroplastic [Linum perenne]